jgi:multicomponent K+:H+ antiporter subunit E
MMSRILPYPMMSLVIFVLWLMLFQSVSPGHLILAFLLGLFLPLTLRKLDVPRGRLRRPFVALGLIFDVFTDVVRSNIAVARIVLTPRSEEIISGLIRIPLDTRSPQALAALACIITATPGTLWVDFDHGEGVLTIHVLDLVDEAGWIDVMKNRYERRLRELFE